MHGNEVESICNQNHEVWSREKVHDRSFLLSLGQLIAITIENFKNVLVLFLKFTFSTLFYFCWFLMFAISWLNIFASVVLAHFEQLAAFYLHIAYIFCAFAIFLPKSLQNHSIRNSNQIYPKIWRQESVNLLKKSSCLVKTLNKLNWISTIEISFQIWNSNSFLAGY